jgi:hypothetical protein
LAVYPEDVHYPAIHERIRFCLLRFVLHRIGHLQGIKKARFPEPFRRHFLPFARRLTELKLGRDPLTALTAEPGQVNSLCRVDPFDVISASDADYQRWSKTSISVKLDAPLVDSGLVYRENLEARAGIEPAHKGFAVLTATRNPLIKQGISVGFWLPKGVDLAPFGTLLATLMATTERSSRLP